MLLRYFNSIKVRLKLEVKATEKATNAAFQFHKGTIKTIYNQNALAVVHISIP